MLTNVICPASVFDAISGTMKQLGKSTIASPVCGTDDEIRDPVTSTDQESGAGIVKATDI